MLSLRGADLYPYKVVIVSANNLISPDPVYPIGASIVASACKRAGHSVYTFDCNFRQTPEADLQDFLKKINPDVIGISLRNIDNTQFPGTTSFIPWYQRVMDVCRKSSNALIVLGGSGYSLFPSELFETLKPDYGIVGDGEHAFPDLLKSISKKERTEKLIYALKTDLLKVDTAPEREFFDIQNYYHRGGMINIQSKRGCAFNCSYCTYPYLEGYRLRLRNVNDVVDEIEAMLSVHGIKYFFFVDSVFNHPEKHAASIAREIVRRKLPIQWSGYIRPEMSDPDILKLFKESGCRSIELGTDSMADETLKSMKKNLTLDNIFSFCEACHDADISFAHSLIFGAPGETLQTAQTTVKNVQQTSPTAALAFLGIRVFPHTEIASFCMKSGYLQNSSDIGLNPLFYLPEGMTETLTSYLNEIINEDPRWIIPGLEDYDMEILKKYRSKKRKGMGWEIKKFIDIIG